jgi:hypothetical protein
MKRLSCVLIFLSLLLSGCYKEKYKKTPPHPISKKDLHITVENKADKPIYASIFYYAKKAIGYRWNWYKTPPQHLHPGESYTFELTNFLSKRELRSVYGYIGISHTQQEADDLVFELIEDSHAIDIGILSKLHSEVIEIISHDEGVSGASWTWKPRDSTKETLESTYQFSLDNQTGEDLWIAPFIYDKSAVQQQWKFRKTPLIEAKKDTKQTIFIPAHAHRINRHFVQGFLGVFKHNDLERAKASTYPSLQPHEKLTVGYLYKLRNRTIILKPFTHSTFSGKDPVWQAIDFDVV